MTTTSRLQTPDSELRTNYSIADTHTHLYFSAFRKDRKKVIDNCKYKNVKLQVQIGCDEVSSVAALELAKNNKNFYCTLGLHPADVKTCFEKKEHYRPDGYENYNLKHHDFDGLFNFFENLYLKNKEKVVGFGETGFDLYHENSAEIFELQYDCLERHLALCEKYEKPAVIHIRNAKKEFLDFLERTKYQKFQAVIHCFGEDKDFAEIMTNQYGFFLGIGGVSTYPNAGKVREAIQQTPIEFLVTETDSPFLVPQKSRATHKRNDASFIPEIVQLIANLKKIPVDTCGEILFKNAKRLFQI